MVSKEGFFKEKKTDVLRCSMSVSKKGVFLGQVMRSVKKFGPFHHKVVFANADTVWPLVAISAGFHSDGTWFQFSQGISSWIFETRLATKFDQRFGVLLIQLSATVESDHANTELIFKIGFSVARMTPHSVEPSRAAQSSSLGTEMVLIGATRVLEQSMCEWKPSEFFETMYATLAYAESAYYICKPLSSFNEMLFISNFFSAECFWYFRFF